MFNMDELNNLEPLSIYISTPYGDLLYPLDEYIQEDTSSLKIHLNNQYELTLSIKSSHGQIWCDYLKEGMYIFVEKIGLFKMKHPTAENDGDTEVINITAYGCDSELEDKNCTLSVNLGTNTSLEYLVKYDDDETELLVNPYTNIPYDWIVLYNTFPEQLEDFKQNYAEYSEGATISLEDNAKAFAQINDFVNLIPRLKHKFVPLKDDNGIDLNDGSTELVEYVSYNYDATTNDLTSITLSEGFFDRIDELIAFYSKYRKQLSLVDIALEKTDGNWTVGSIYGLEDGDYSLSNTKCQFDTDENIYSFFTQTLPGSIECITTFDIINRKVSITPIDAVGQDTGIIYSYDNLMNNLGISSDEENLCTRLYVTGADGITFEQVNFGRAYIDNLEYKMNIRDSNGNRIYVTDELADKYCLYSEMMERKRERYIELSKQYNDYSEQIDEIKYRVPNDGLKTDWSTYTEEELNEALVSYKNLLKTLITLYKEDYGDAGLNEDNSVNEDYIRGTIYWHDYKAYKDIIAEIECAIAVFPYYSQKDKWHISKIDSEELKLYLQKITAWETEWSLYGSIELQAKIDSYTQNMNLLAESSVIKKPESDEIYTWEELENFSDAALRDLYQAAFVYQKINYKYDEYMEMYNHRSDAMSYLSTLTSEINDLEELRKLVQEERKSIANAVSLESNFTAEEIKLLNLMIKESDYANENILITTVDNSNDKINKMLELLEDGKEKISIFSRPQLIFETNADNVFGLTEFSPIWKDFKCGNYIAVQYKDDTYIKVRLIGFEFNPRLPSSNNTNLMFSNFLRSKSKISDISSILENASSTSRSVSTPSGSSGDKFGASDKIDVTISNTMLSQLLNSEIFGTRVRDVILDTIDVNAITAQTLKSGIIISGNYSSKQLEEQGVYGLDNITGSIIRLDDGSFSFAGGSLKWESSKSDDVDGRLKIRGDLIVEEEFDENGSLTSGVYLGAPGSSLNSNFTSTLSGYFEEDAIYTIEFSNAPDADIVDSNRKYDLEDMTNNTMQFSHSAPNSICLNLFRPGITKTDIEYSIPYIKYSCEIDGVIYTSNDIIQETENGSDISVLLHNIIMRYMYDSIKTDDTYEENGENGLNISLRFSELKQCLEDMFNNSESEYHESVLNVEFSNENGVTLIAEDLLESSNKIQLESCVIKITLGGKSAITSPETGVGQLVGGLIGTIFPGYVASYYRTLTKYTYRFISDNYDSLNNSVKEDVLLAIQKRLYNNENKPIDESTINDLNREYRRLFLVQENIFTIIDNDKISLSIGKEGLYCSNIYSDSDMTINTTDGYLTIEHGGNSGIVMYDTITDQGAVGVLHIVGDKIQINGSIQPNVLYNFPDYNVKVDFNDVTDINIYVGNEYLGNGESGDAAVFNYINSPVNHKTSFLLEVLPSGSNGQKLQRLTTCEKENSEVWERFFYSNTWGAWKRIR